MFTTIHPPESAGETRLAPAYRLIFLGTPDFAVPSLNALASDPRFEIIAVVTQPDRPVGRKGTITPPPVKVAAQNLGIKEIRQPEKLTDPDFRAWIENIGPKCDAFVVVAYGKIFRDWFLALPTHGLFNVHASLLPRWRGASPINAAIASGDAETGVSIMTVAEEMDAGDVYAVAKTPIAEDETAESLHDRLAEMGAQLLPDTLASILSGQLSPTSQDDSLATYCKTLTREDGRADWNQPAKTIERLVRAYTPWPGVWTEIDGKRLKILKAREEGRRAQGAGRGTESMSAPGSRLILDSGYPAIACGNNTMLELLVVQPEGGKPIDGKDYLRGVTW